MMESQNINVVYERVKQDHAKYSEQMILLKSALPFLNDKKNLESVEQIVDFFKQKIMPHFQWEEREVFPTALVLGWIAYQLFSKRSAALIYPGSHAASQWGSAYSVFWKAMPYLLKTAALLLGIAYMAAHVIQ